MRREGGRGAREPRTNNEKKSPTNIFFPFFSNPQLDLVWGGEGGENLNCPLRQREQRRGRGWGEGSRRGPTLSECLLLTNGPDPRSAQPPVAHGPSGGRAAWECLPPAGGSSGFSPCLWPPRVRVRCVSHLLLRCTRPLNLPRVGLRVTSWERFMTFSEILSEPPCELLLGRVW